MARPKSSSIGANMATLRNSLPQALKSRGVSRREFVKFCQLMVATLALPTRYLSAVEKALSQATRPVLVWLEFQDCAGNSESMLRTSNPTVTEFVLDLLSWEYHELIMAGAGKQAEAALERVVQEHKGEYIAVVEGAIPTADGGVYCTIAARLLSKSLTTFAPIRQSTSRLVRAPGMEVWSDRTQIRPAPSGCRRRCRA